MPHQFLLAVDTATASQRELQYVNDIIQNNTDVKLYLLHIYPEPPPDYYSQGGNESDYTKEYEEQTVVIFEQCRAILTNVKPEDIITETIMAEEQSLSDIILAKQKKLQCDTVVLGKRGISKAEEFLFGSVSNAVVRASHDFAVWIVS